MLKKETLVKIKELLGDDNADLVTEIETDQSEFANATNEVAQLKSFKDSVGDMDIAKAKAIIESMESSGIKTPADIANLIQKGEATEQQKSDLQNKIQSYELQIEQSHKELVLSEAKNGLMSGSTHGSEKSALAITKMVGADGFKRENGTILGKDATGNWYDINSKEYRTFIDTEYGDIIPKPNLGTSVAIQEGSHTVSKINATWADATSTN